MLCLFLLAACVVDKFLVFDKFLRTVLADICACVQEAQAHCSLQLFFRSFVRILLLLTLSAVY